MYYYICDSFVNQKKYELLLHKIEGRLLELGINGRIEKLTLLKNLKELIEEGIKREADTIVVIGDDKTIGKVISFLPNFSVTLGIIPIGPKNRIAKILGIPEGEAACDVLSARIIEKIDLGKVNNNYFISSLEIPFGHEVIIECDNYSISTLSSSNKINICNFGNILDNKIFNKIYDPKDGKLEIVISPDNNSSGFFNLLKRQFSKDSVFPIKKAKIKCLKECLPVIADGEVTVKTPVSVEVMPKKLKIIVGKNRMF